MPAEPADRRDRAAIPRPYAHDTRPATKGRRRHQPPAGYTLFDAAEDHAFYGQPKPEPEPEPEPAHLTPVGPHLGLILDWIGYTIVPEPREPGDALTRAWRLEAPGVPTQIVGEVADPDDDDLRAADPAHRGLWCSCSAFFADRRCGHVDALADAGLLRPAVVENPWKGQEWAYFDVYAITPEPGIVHPLDTEGGVL